ncbi:MAG: TetR/AcrR family transcriptional regulator [Pseudomonadota bacterium]
MDRPLPAKTRAARPATTYHHGDLRNALLREGRALLETLGATELSLREVARRAGVSEAAPSRHFEGKEGLLAGIAAEGFRELAAQRRAIAAQDTGTLAKVRDMLLSYVRYAQQNKGVFHLMVGPRILDPTRHLELVEVGNESFQLFAGAVVDLAVEHGWPRRQVELVTHSAWAVEHGLATLILADRAPNRASSVQVDRMISFSVDMILSAIVAGPDGLLEVQKGGPARRRKASPTAG